MAGHLSNDEFFTQLTLLIASTQEKGHGSIHLTQKRLIHDTLLATEASTSKINPLWDLQAPSQPLPLIVRATDGKTQSEDRKKNKAKVKLSTLVQPEEIEAFFARYAEVCKAGMQSLKKRDRSKRKKDKSKKKK